MEVSESNKKIAKFVAGAIGWEPHVFSYYDENETHSIDILDLMDPIDKNVKIYCSIGLSDYDNIIEMKNGKNNIPVEILLAAHKEYEKAPNILSTCCFYIIKNNYSCQPGTVYKNMVEIYGKNNQMKHIMFIRPFLWEEKIGNFKIENKKINFLMGVPISDEELEFKIKNGADELMDKIMENKVDIYNYNRASVI